PKELDELASHFDLAPSLLAFLEKNHDVVVPKRTAWMGGGLTMQGRFNEDKEIPFNGSERKGKEMLVKGNRYLEGDKVYAVREGLTLKALPSEDHIDLANAHQHLEMLQEYVLKKNRIVPDLEATTQPNGSSLGKKEMVYVNSVLHNDDFDLAYSRARKLAFDKKYRQASTLCKYILQEVPSYIDARILLGRIHAWQGHYKKAEEILRESIKKNTVYGEAYAALLDVYFWSDQNEKALGLYKIIEENGISDKTLAQKLRRAYKKIQQKYPPHRIVSFVDIADFEKHLKT
ncbi:MAG: tetratricopeptide repeat protein, partial [Flavobacteriaceae bacterium]